MSIGWSAIAPLILGLLIGWAIEWVIDWIWWRRRGVSQADLAALQAKLTKTEVERENANSNAQRLSTELADLRLRLAASHTMMEQHKSELGTVKKQLGDHQSSMSDLQHTATQLQANLDQAKLDLIAAHEKLGLHAAEISTYKALAASAPRQDPLIDINGIGPVYEDRLFAAGIYTFAQLAEQPHDRIREIIELKDWQDVDLDSWIAEAREFAQQVQNGTYRKGRS